MRLIDADRLCEDLLNRWNIADTRKEELIRQVMADVVTPIVISQPTIEPQKWISCDERLPEVGQKVLASTNKTCFTQVFKGTSGASNSSWWWEKKTIKHIVAWMPLPDPYKEDKT